MTRCSGCMASSFGSAVNLTGSNIGQNFQLIRIGEAIANMNWQCNRCGHTAQPIKEVELDGADWPAGRCCSKCLRGEMVCRPVNPQSLKKTSVAEK